MRRFPPLLLLPALAACAGNGPRFPEGSPLSSLFPSPEPEVVAPPPLPPAVQAALPPGVPPSVVLQDASGCYLYSVEVTDPPSGFPLRDAAGNPICEGGAAPLTTVASTPLAAPPPGAVVAGAGLAPTTPPLAPVVPVTPGAPGAFAPGSITPPAPLAPLNP